MFAVDDRRDTGHGIATRTAHSTLSLRAEPGLRTQDGQPVNFSGWCMEKDHQDQVFFETPDSHGWACSWCRKVTQTG